jgi:hypothetical protein
MARQATAKRLGLDSEDSAEIIVQRGGRTPAGNAATVFCDISISADGYAAGPGQTAEKPFGDGPVDRLHAWMLDSPDENKAEIDQVVAAGAFVMGRNMFGPGGDRTSAGKAGGAMTRRTTHPCSCSPTTRASRWPWRAARRSPS